MSARWPSLPAVLVVAVAVAACPGGEQRRRGDSPAAGPGSTTPSRDFLIP